MNDSRTLELWKTGQFGPALIRTAMYVSGALLGLGIFVSIVTLSLAAVMFSPWFIELLRECCKYFLSN